MSQKLQMTMGEVYTPDCAADLGDARCAVNLAVLEESGTVDTVIDGTTFETTLVQRTGWYDGDELLWTGGANAGQTVAVRSWDAETGTLTLFLPALYSMQTSDAFTIRPGCYKTFATCEAKFDNAINFRGFPHVPATTKSSASCTCDAGAAYLSRSLNVGSARNGVTSQDFGSYGASIRFQWPRAPNRRARPGC